MQEIDFLPEKYRRNTTRKHARQWRIVMLSVCAVLIGLVTFFERMQTRGLVRELHAIVPDYTKARETMQRLAALRTDQKQADVLAEWTTFLRHPWPKTSILMTLFQEWPASARLTELEIKETPKPLSPGTNSFDQNNPAQRLGQQELEKPTLEQELKSLREATEREETVATLIGFTHSLSEVHDYLANLGKNPLIVKAELKSIEGAQTEKQSELKFTMRIIIRQGHGLRVGPQPVSASPKPPVASATNNRQLSQTKEGERNGF